jgi:hypothetical protein
MSWKSYPKISQDPKLRSQVLKTMSWKPKISQVFLHGRPGLPVRQTDERTDGRTDEQTDGRTNRRTDGRTDGRTDRRTDGRTNGHREGLQNRPRRLPVQKSDCPGRISFSESDCPGRFRRRIKTRNCRVTHKQTNRQTTWIYI